LQRFSGVVFGRNDINKLPFGHDEFAAVGISADRSCPVLLLGVQRQGGVFGQRVHDRHELYLTGR